MRNHNLQIGQAVTSEAADAPRTPLRDMDTDGLRALLRSLSATKDLAFSLWQITGREEDHAAYLQHAETWREIDALLYERERDTALPRE